MICVRVNTWRISSWCCHSCIFWHNSKNAMIVPKLLLNVERHEYRDEIGSSFRTGRALAEGDLGSPFSK